MRTLWFLSMWSVATTIAITAWYEAVALVIQVGLPLTRLMPI